MAKLSIDQRIAKTEEAIIKEEILIEESKEKVKSLKSELKTLQTEKEKSFANEVIKLLKAKGINQDKFLSELKTIPENESSDFSSPNDKKKTSEENKNDSPKSSL